MNVVHSIPSTHLRASKRSWMNGWHRLLLLFTLVLFSLRSACAVPIVYGAISAYDLIGNFKIRTPIDLVVGDLIVLYLSRSDGPIPHNLFNGWRLVASCLKRQNEEPSCVSCLQVGADGYCEAYSHGLPNADDLGTNVFVKVATEGDIQAGGYQWLLHHQKPTWAFIMGVKNVDVQNPIRSWTGATCDREFVTVFPSTAGKAGDLLLMHMSFDDTAFRSEFLPPTGAQFISWVKGTDETGFLFSEPLVTDGATAVQRTGGPGGPACKDVEISLVLSQTPVKLTPVPTLRPTSRPSPQPSNTPTLGPPTLEPTMQFTPRQSPGPSIRPTGPLTPAPSRRSSPTPVLAPVLAPAPTKVPIPSPIEPPQPNPTFNHTADDPREYIGNVDEMSVVSDATVDLPDFKTIIRSSPSISRASSPPSTSMTFGLTAFLSLFLARFCC